MSLHPKNSFRDLRQFILTNAEELANTSLRLGGPSELFAAQILIDQMARAQHLTPQLIRGLQRCYDLLILKHEFALDHECGEFLADLNPASSEVEDICRFTERYAKAFASLCPHSDAA